MKGLERQLVEDDDNDACTCVIQGSIVLAPKEAAPILGLGEVNSIDVDYDLPRWERKVDFGIIQIHLLSRGRNIFFEF